MRLALALSVIALFFSIVPGLPAAAQDHVPGATVEQLIALAKERNPDFAAMLREADAAAERIEPADALPDPKLRTEFMDITKGGTQNATLSPNRTGSTRYTLMQEFPWFGKRDLKREIAALELKDVQSRAEVTWNDVAARIKTNFAQAWYLAASEKLNKEILELNMRLEKIAHVRYAGGLAAQQDVIRAQVEQTLLRNDLIALAGERQRLQSRINALLGRTPSAPLAMPRQLRPLPAPEKLDFAALAVKTETKNPALFADESRVLAAEKNRDLTYKNRFPDVTLGIVPNQFQNAIKQWDFMVEINIPLQQSSRRAKEREAEAVLEAARARKEATANQAIAELAESLSALDAARQGEAIIASSLLPQAELTFKSALVGYESGKVNFATVLDAQRQFRQAKLNRIKAQAESQARLADIERIVGEEL